MRSSTVIPACPTCRLWGQGSCRAHQPQRGCPGCGGRGVITWGRMIDGVLEAGEEPCLCTRRGK